MKRIRLNQSAKFLLALALPTAAWADINSTATVNAGSKFSFDTGAVVTSGGDITYTGTSITYQGSAKGGVLPGVMGAATFSAVSLQILQSLAALATTAPIPSSSLPVGAIVGIQTNQGNGAKLLVTAISSTSISFQFTTFGATAGGGGGAGAPTITSVLNNSSLIPPGFPNSGLTPSTLFHVFGTNMAMPGTVPVLQDSTKGLPTTLNGASLSATVGGTTVQPAIYYSSPTDIAGVLPANTPVGSGTLTVSYNNLTATTNIQVVQTAFGFDIYNGAAVATDAVSGALITYTNSAKPGETLLFWGTGIGADPNHSDTVGGSNNNITMPVTFYIGGVQVPAGNVVFTGALFYPGVQGFGVTIPQGVPNGCFVPIVAVTGSGANQAVSSTPTLPIMSGGGTCSDSVFGITGTGIGTLGSQNTVKAGTLLIGQGSSNSQVSNLALATFSSVPGTSYASSGGLVTLGACVLTETVPSLSAIVNPVIPTPLDAGSISVQGPSGSYNLSSLTKGSYVAQLPAGAIPSTGGSFVFTGTGGADVGAFNGTVTLPNPLLSWTNQPAAATINRGQGLAVTWTGGAPNSYVLITGGSSGAGGANGSFICYVPQNLGSFNVPAYITSALPAGNGQVTVENATSFSTFTAPGLDYGYGFGFVSAAVQSTFQ